MSQRENTPTRVRWARLRFSIIDPVLASPPGEQQEKQGYRGGRGAPLSLRNFSYVPRATETHHADQFWLKVSEDACALNLAQDYFEVTNSSTGPASLSNITIKYWINDTSGVHA